MQLKTVKTAADLPFKGVELVKVDSTVSEVVIGGRLFIRPGQYSGIQVLVQAPGEKAQRHRVTAKLDGFAPTVEFFESSYEASERADHFRSLGASVEQEHVSVLIADDGSIRETADEPEATPELADLPF